MQIAKKALKSRVVLYLYLTREIHTVAVSLTSISEHVNFNMNTTRWYQTTFQILIKSARRDANTARWL